VLLADLHSPLWLLAVQPSGVAFYWDASSAMLALSRSGELLHQRCTFPWQHRVPCLRQFPAENKLSWEKECFSKKICFHITVWVAWLCS